MLPDDILNLNLVNAVVVLKYPALKLDIAYLPPPLSSAIEWFLEIKCFTNVVLDGSNICKTPTQLASLSADWTTANLKNDVDCASSWPVL